PVLLDATHGSLGDERDRRRPRDRVLPRHPRRREDRRPASPRERRMTVVDVKDVSKQFGRGGTIALQGIDLEIAEREFISLIGPSGCGKSTLLRIIGDLIQPSSGSVVVNGKPAREARIDRDYGIVFQDPVLYDWRTVGKNIALPLEMARWPRRRRSERVREMLDLVELGGFGDHHPW